MITAERAHDILLTMPVVEEKQKPGYQDFRVKGRLFAKLWLGAGLANLKVGKDEQFMLSSQGKMFSITKGGNSVGWITVKLGLLGEKEFLDVVWKAWRHVAGPNLSLQYY